MKLITICIPFFNEEENIYAVHKELTKLADSLKINICLNFYL